MLVSGRFPVNTKSTQGAELAFTSVLSKYQLLQGSFLNVSVISPLYDLVCA